MNAKKITRFLSFLLFLLIANIAFSQSWKWATKEGGKTGGSSLDGGQSIAVDKLGNTFVAGYFQDTITFGSKTFYTKGTYTYSKNVFIAKFNPSGNLIWAVQAGYPLGLTCSGIALDDSNNIYITGSFEDSALFGTKKIYATKNNVGNIFLAKSDSSGNFKWALSQGAAKTTSANVLSNCIAVDNSGNPYIAGDFNGTFKIGSTTLSNYGGYDIFIEKFNGSGVSQWAASAGGTSNDHCDGIAIDTSGVYFTGYISGNAAIFGSLSIYAGSNEDIYLAKYSLSGSAKWVTKAANFITSSAAQGNSVTIDQLTGDPIITGTFNKADSFGTAHADTIYTKGGYDVFVARYSAAGAFKWVTSNGSKGGNDYGNSITTDVFGNTILTGSFQDTVAINGSNYISAGSDDIFLAKLNASGSVISFATAGGTGSDIAYSLVDDRYGNAYLTGYFSNGAKFGTTKLTANGGTDIFNAEYQYNTCTSGMSGTYTIGATGANFKTITKAVNHLDSVGVCGPVIFNIASGKYNEAINITAIPGSSATNTVTFQSAALDSTKVTIDYTGTNSNLWQFDGAYFITLKDLTLRGTSSSGNNAVVNLINNAGDISLLNCRFYGVYSSGSFVIEVGNYSNDTNILIKNNIIKYADYGIYTYGNPTVEGTGLVIQGNLIDSNYYYNMDVYYQDGPHILGNTITNSEYGIVIYYCNNGIQIIKNKVTSLYYTLYNYYNDIGTGSTVTQTTPTLIANNFFSSASYYGVLIYNSSYQDLYFNNINCTEYDVLYYNYPGSGITYTGNNQENNNFVATTSNAYTIYLNATTNSFIKTSDYNNYYNGSTGSSALYLIDWNGTSYNTLASYKTASGKDAHSINVNPNYKSGTDLHVSNTALHDAGLPMPALVPDDIDGQFRSPNAVTIGADEMFPNSNDAGISAIYPAVPYAAGTETVQARLENFGKNTLTSATVNWQINGTTGTAYSWTGSLASGATAIVSLGTNNFVLGNSYTIKIWSSSPNGTTDGDHLNDTMEETSCPGLAGTYTVGTATGSSFATFNDAVNALSCGGAAGPVVFSIEPGTYTEQVDVPAIKYSSATNTVTFDGGAGNTANCILTYAASASTASHTFRLNNTHNIIVKNLTIQTTGSKYGSAVHIFGSSGTNEIENCVLKIGGNGATSSSSYFIPLLINNTTDITNPTSAINANNIFIENDTFINGYYGIYAFVSNNQNNLFTGNVISNAYLQGAYLYGFDGLTFTQDSINMRAGNEISTGLYVSGGNTVAPALNRINQNKIINAGQYGMNINASNSNEDPGEIINNMVGGGFTDSTGPYGINLNGTDWNIWYNTVNLDVYSYNSTSAAFNLASGDTNDVEDNIFAVTGGGNALSVYINSTSSVSNFGYNDYYVQGLKSTGDLIYFGGNYTPSNFKGAGSYNSKSVDIDPDFLSNTDLHIEAPCLAGLGTPMNSYPDALYDIFGTTRSYTAPTMGAEEFKPFGYNLGLTSIVTPSGAVSTSKSYNVTVKGFNYGSTTITSLRVSYSINGGTPVVQHLTGLSIAGCDSITVKFTATSGPGSSSQQAKFSGGINTLEVYSDTINGTMDQYPANDTVKEALCTPLSGTFTINNSAAASSTNFTSFSAAAASLTGCGINGPVVFNVADGTYNENVYIGNIDGVSSTNTVIFQSKKRDTSKVILTSAASSTSTTPNFTLLLDSSKFVAFKYMTIQRTGSGTYGDVIVLANGANADTFIGNIITGIKTSGNNGNICDIAAVGNDTGNNYLRNRISYGSYGMLLVGLGKTYPKNNYIQNNTIDSPSYAGIGMDSIGYVMIQHDSITGVTGSNGYGIALLASIGNSVIKKNKIYLPNGGAGIIMDADSSTAIGAMYVQNNFISVGGSSASYGLFSQNNLHQNYYYNSVNITNKSVNSYGAYFDATSSNDSGINILDNCWVNTGGGLAEELTANAVSVGYISTSDYNNFYTGRTNLASYNGTTYKTIATYSTNSGYEAHSISVNPGYKSAVDLHASNGALAVGIAVSGVLEDIDDQIRPVVDPDIGADQFVSPADAGIDSIVSPNIGSSCSGKINVIVRLRNFGTSQLVSGNINWAINGTAQTSYSWTGALNPKTTVDVTIGTMTLSSGSSYTIIAGTSNPNGGKDVNDANDSITSKVYTGLSGTYTIGATGSNYSSFGAAVSDLKTKGVCGPVTFNVKSGTYNEQVRITKIIGASPTNTITFQSSTLDSANVILTQASSASASANYTLELDSANYITFNEITIQRTGSGAYGTVIQLADSADNNQLLNNQIFGVKATSQGTSQVLVYSLQPDTANLISNNYMLYGGTSIYLAGSATLGYGKSNKIIGNEIDSPYYACVYLSYQNGGQVLRNSLGNTLKNVSAYGYGVYLNRDENQIEIMQNRIYLPISGSGIFSNTTVSSSSSKPALIANNFITVGGSGVSYGINSFDDGNVDYYFNSVLINNTNSNSYAANFNSFSSTTINDEDNIFMNSRGGYAIGIQASGYVNISDYNDLFADSGTNYGNYLGSNYSSLASWQSNSGYDAHSDSANPLFVSYTNLDARNRAIYHKGIYTNLVTTDIHGTTRHNPPSIGADEFAPPLPDAGISAIDSPATNFCPAIKNVIVTLKNFSSIVALDTVTINWSVNGTVQTTYKWTGTLSAGSSTNITLGTYSFSGGSNAVKAWTSSPNNLTDGNHSNDTSLATLNVYNNPSATVGSNKSFCLGSSATIGATAVGSDTYSWSSNPTGYSSTVSNPTVSPTVTTTYTLLETTSNNCKASNSVVVTVNPLPLANAGSNDTICNGASKTIGAAAISGHTYSWVSAPSGFTSTSANPSVSPASTTTYTLTETITATGCTNSNSITVKVNPLPSASAGSNTSICSGSSTSIGASAISGDTYSWASNPSGFSSTASNPSVSPTTTTTYTLTETITATGCTKSNSVVITVNPLPSANTGSNKTICTGSSAAIGASALTGHTYAWVSNPSGFTSTSANSSVSPTVTTTYTLTETITATGCTNSNSVTVTVNPLPAANAGSSSSICTGASASIGSKAVGGDTYSWSSSPSGYSSTASFATVSPTVTTTYTLTETITATGCTKSNSVTITINPLPNATTGSNKAICTGSSTSIGASAVTGDTYSWTSKPSGFTTTSSNPTISPTATTTYYLTETITATSCTKADTVIITVDPLPVAATGSNKTICSGTPTSIGATAVSGDTYSWISKPSGFSSSSSKPTVSPTTTTTYYLTETITASNCSKTDSVVITVNPLPLANTGSNKAICNTGSTSIGSTAVSGDTYSWSSNPSGFSNTNSNPSVSPTLTTTYYLTETITATSCSKTDSVVITVNPLPLANAGSSKSICNGASTAIGATAITGHTYSWVSSPSGFTSTSANPSVNPTATTTYTLTETITATGCTQSNSVTITVNPLPTANAGSSKSICNGSSTSIGASAVSGDTYSWSSSPSGYSSTVANPSVSPTTTTTYTLTETITATGCTKSNTVVITVNPLPLANAGSNKPICTGSTTSIGSSAVSGDTYSWSSNPSGFTSTSASPSISPTSTTTYTLTETITATGCTKSNSVTITVNPLPVAATGSNKAICTGSSTNVGATAVSGDTYSWTSNPSGFTSTVSKPTISPTITTTYYLTETVSSTSCSKSDSVVITVNLLPLANSGSNKTICNTSSVSIGSTAVSGDTYSWSSNPSGYSNTSSNPSVSPTNTTTYYLTETITATSCSKTDSVVISVNSLPLANTGSNKAICYGASTSIGGSAVSGNTYSWISNPSGFTSTSSNPTVAPTTTTTYTLTETVTGTGCTKSNSVVITVNPLPVAATGSNKAICTGSSTTIGASAVSGDTYSWSSAPSGFSSTLSKPTINPTATTTYTLVETITATGCTQSNSVVITVNPLPTANAGSNSTICNGNSASIGATAVSGDTYSWGSKPSGYSSTASSATVSPTTTTTYFVTETITATGCSKTDSVKITVNPLPLAVTGSNQPICYGAGIIIGTASITGHTYSWTSNPSGFTSTKANPSISPTLTTTYYLTEIITSTSCSKSDSVVIKVNPLPLANAGSSASICFSGSTQIGTSAVSGDTYSWTSNPSGYTSNSANPTVSPTTTTTYTLIEKITATGCTNSNAVTITVNPLPSANAGSTQTICAGSPTTIGASAVSGDTYSWISNPSGFTSTMSKPSISPTTTTTYTLTETITATGCTKSSTVIIDVNPLPAANTGGATAVCVGHSAKLGAAAVSGDTYSWYSSPTGFTSTVSNPTISPTVSGTYYLTEKITATGCTKTDSVLIFLTPPAITGGNRPLCKGSSIELGDSTIGNDKYVWKSVPTGFSDTTAHPVVSPTTTTTYILTETVRNGGCNKTDSAIITVYPLPTPKAGSAQTTCAGNSITIGGVSTTGHSYYWVSNPAGFKDSLTSSPTVSPTITTTYYVTETITATGCSKSDSVVITVNPLPAANSGSNNIICFGTSSPIGATAVSGDTYLWKSKPSGYTSTSSNPSVSPTTSTTYYLTEKITATACKNSDSVVITVNPLPLATTGSNKPICFGGSTSIGGAAVTGDTYSWTSKPSGYTSTTSNPTINPTITTTYYLTEEITATGCSKSDSVIITVNPLPAANAGSSQVICLTGSASVGGKAVSGDTYSWTSNPSGYTSTSSNPTVSPTATNTYYLTEKITATGCTKSDSVIITVNPLPVANAGSNGAICFGGSTSIGGTTVSGNTYSWTSKPSGYSSTNSNPIVNPTTTTTYTLTETITATGCTKSNSVIITVNPLPAANAGSNQPLCNGASTSIGATGVSGDTYSWTSNPSGYTSTAPKPTANPTATTTYYLTETITATGCTKYDSVVITVNPLPLANAGSSTSICYGGSTSIGGTAVSGDTYLWTSSPSGYTSTSASPSVGPTTTTTYYLTEKITATGCTKSNSVVITVNPLPAANAGSNNAICLNGSTSIGATGVSGDTYSWTSNPSGYTSTSPKPTVNPTTTTTYTLTETITATGCTKSNSIVITVNPLPAANAGSNQPICFGGSASIGGTAISGDTYSWTSNPSGYTSTSPKPTVNPTTTTTYTLTETITATGCTKSNSIVITVNPLPAANAGTNQPICLGGSTSIGGTAVSGDIYSWTSNPSGYTSTVSSPTVSPTVITTYYLTEKITVTGCNKSDSVIITVNPLPAANAGTNQPICFGGSTSIGGASVSGDTYLWTSSPSGYTSTASNPTVGPTTTTTYTLTETITVTGCTKSNSVVITVNPLPAANAGTNQPICFGGSTSIGVTAVSGDTYSWTSNPSGFTSTISNPTVNPTATTTYTLTETITATGCTKSNSVVITVNPLPAANAGTNQPICFGGSTSIGGASVSGDTYSWTSSPSGYTSTTSNPTVGSTTTTTYTLTETITVTGCTKSNSIVITVNPLPAANAGGNSAICFGGSSSIGATTVSGDTYSWTSKPAGYTSTNSNPTVNPTATTTYYLTETITTTSCTNSDSVVITVNPLPAANAGTNQPICFGGSTSIGATAVSGDTYSWTSKPSGYTSTASNPTVNPTATTTFYLTETITTTSCTKSDSVVITVNPLPAANAGTSQPICFAGSTAIGATAISGDTYSWTSKPSGYTSTTSNPTISPTTTTTYYLTETITATGCTKSDSVVITVNPLPAAKAGSNQPVCFGGSATIGTTAVSGDIYSWTSNPSGFTSTASGPSVSPTITTTYYLIEKITATGCTKSDSVVITVNPLPAANAGSSSAICFGGSAYIGATGVSGDTYSWTSNPSGYSSTLSHPSVSPTTTTTYYLTEKITTTSCTKSDSIVITVNPLPAANAGSGSAICSGTSITIGATAVSGDTYSWTSKPSGYSSTNSNPSVNPLKNTTYYLIEKITATSCTNSDSMVITVNPLPAANAGSKSTICSGASSTIGATAVTGDTYSWSSKPSGYSSTSSSPSVSPTVTTTYYLTETITATSCTKSDSVVISVNPLPAANAGNSSTACSGASTSIGAIAVTGNTYSWSSKPSGYSSTASNPIVNPTRTTTYYLKEKITATGCTNTDSVVITVNPLPAAAAGNRNTICAGSSYTIGATAVTGDTYSWSSKPSGYSSTSSSPSVSPTVTTTYYLTETITATNCSKSDSVIITVNPLPAANPGNSSAICSGASVSIGAIAVSGDTYVWTSKPSGYSSTTSNPTVSPVKTTTYYLKERITVTGCTKSDSVVITVNPLPAANAGINSAICSGTSAIIGATSVTGDIYSWTSKPSGYTSTSSSPSVSPTLTTTYYLTENVTASGCSKSDSVVITVNPLPAANAGTSSIICFGTSEPIGSTAVSGDTYSWTSKPSGYTSTTSNPSVSPTATTTYYLTEKVKISGCSKSDSVVITVNPLPAANVGGNGAICIGGSAFIGATTVSGDTYSWTSKPSGYTSTTSNPSVSPTVTTTYYLTEKITATSCNKSDSVVITVSPLPVASILGATSTCANSSVNYKAASSANTTYTWYVTGGVIISGQGTDSIIVNWSALSGTISLAERNSGGCRDSIGENINLLALPVDTIKGPVTACSKVSTMYMANHVAGNTYNWSVSGGTIVSGQNSDTVNVMWTSAGSDSITVKETNSSSCSGSATIAVTVTATPVQPSIVPGTADTLVATPNNATSYQWYYNGTAISGANSYKYAATASGAYTVDASNGVCASAVSASYSFTGIGSTDNIISSFKLYPNPAQTTISIDAIFARPTTISVELLNTLGQSVMQLDPQRVVAGEYNNSFYVGDLARGMYYLKVTTTTGQLVQRIMKD